MKQYILFMLLIFAVIMTGCNNEKEEAQTKESAPQQEKQETVTQSDKNVEEKANQEQEVIKEEEKGCDYLKFNGYQLNSVAIIQELNRTENGRYLSEWKEYQANRMDPEIICQIVEKINSLSDSFVDDKGSTGIIHDGDHDNHILSFSAIEPGDLYSIYGFRVSVKKDTFIQRHFEYTESHGSDRENTSYAFDEAKLDELLAFLETVKPTWEGVK